MGYVLLVMSCGVWVMDYKLWVTCYTRFCEVGISTSEAGWLSCISGSGEKGNNLKQYYFSQKNCRRVIILISIPTAVGWWSPPMPVKLYQLVKDWGGCNNCEARRGFNVKEQLGEGRVSCTVRHQQMLYFMKGESENKGWLYKHDQNLGLYLKELERAEYKMSLPETLEKQEDGISPHVEVKKLKSKSQGAAAPMRVHHVTYVYLCLLRHVPRT